uniref:Uncharacterized protein n=1 Tax=viral metagenome TaxID=1070528 RepID=A0A6M3LM19_9ZZZZ
MNNLAVITNTVTGDELAYTYMELHQQSPNSRGIRRYRIIGVNRDGRIAEYREDMGLAKKYKGVKELHIPALWEHTVDELRDLADDLRNETNIDLKDFLSLEKMVLA